jgi:hypothetical protein
MIERDIIITVHRASCKVPVTLVRFERNFNSLGRFSKNIKLHENPSSVRRVDPYGRMDGQTDGQKDTTKLIVASQNYKKKKKKKKKINEGEKTLTL